MTRQHLGEAEGADQRRDQRDAAGEIGMPKVKRGIGVDALLPDHRDEQAEEARDPALQRRRRR